MINSKAMLLKRLKENKDNLIFETILHQVMPKLEGIKRKVGKVQTNAFSLLTDKEGEIIDSWVYPYCEHIQVKNNVLTYLSNDGVPSVEIKIIEENQKGDQL